jgi:hypothetical protein
MGGKRNGALLWKRVGEQSGVGEAEVVGSDYDVVEHPDAEDLRSLNQAVRAIAVFTGRGRISGWMVVLCAAPSYVTSTGINGIFLGRCTVHTNFHSK